MIAPTRKHSQISLKRLIPVLWVSLLLLGSQFVIEQHDCTNSRADHGSNCPVCWISFSSGDIVTSATENVTLTVELAAALPAPRPFVSLPSLTSDSRAPPAA
jgi:hypothetical protein